MLYQNAHSVLKKYRKNEKIVDIQLKFGQIPQGLHLLTSSYRSISLLDTAPFPAITLCNLNPYKASSISRVETVGETLLAFDQAMDRAGITDAQRSKKISKLLGSRRNMNPDSASSFEVIFHTWHMVAYPIQGMHDEVAIVSKAKENMMFAVSELSKEDRLRLSHTKTELVCGKKPNCYSS